MKKTLILLFISIFISTGAYASKVEVSDLSFIDLDSEGDYNDEIFTDIWDRSSSFDNITYYIRNLPINDKSKTFNELKSKLLRTKAAPPEGIGYNGAFLFTRLHNLYKSGNYKDVANILDKIRDDRLSPVLLKLKIDNDIKLGHFEKHCDGIEKNSIYFAQLDIFCKIKKGEKNKASLAFEIYKEEHQNSENPDSFINIVKNILENGEYEIAGNAKLSAIEEALMPVTDEIIKKENEELGIKDFIKNDLMGKVFDWYMNADDKSKQKMAPILYLKTKDNGYLKNLKQVNIVEVLAFFDVLYVDYDYELWDKFKDTRIRNEEAGYYYPYLSKEGYESKGENLLYALTLIGQNFPERVNFHNLLKALKILEENGFEEFARDFTVEYLIYKMEI